MDLFRHEGRVKPLEGEQSVLQVEEPQLDLLEASPLEVQVALRLAVEEPPMELVLLNLTPHSD